ncbi:FCGBP protein, partial [Todus mexicanus]|nr:FCGBP protein [Todus mexicanus]
LKTDFDLLVTFDWHSYARVFLPATYSGAVCGLCGNADGDPADDFSLANGSSTTNATQFGDSWKVAEVAGCAAGCVDNCRVCGEVEKRHYGGDKHCGLLVKKGGALATCHGVVDPAPFFSDCLFDACLYEGHQETVCRSLGAYAAACQEQGVAIGPWRSDDFCPMACPPNQHYELCGPSCPPTCHGQSQVELCQETTPCSEGCFCDPGFLKSGDRCVPVARCGCVFNGSYHQVGEDFVPCPRCSRRCRCRPDGTVECWPEACGEDQECGVKDGVRGCHPRACGRCQLLGAGGGGTFDGRRLRLGGSCTYRLVEVVGGGPEDLPLVDFTVEVEKERGEAGSSVVRRLTVAVGGVAVALERGVRWEVDGERHLLPLALAEGTLTVSQEGAHRVLQVRGGPKLLYDGDSYVVLTLPNTYGGHTRGLCGNFNGDPHDDLEELGDAWSTSTSNCTHGPPPPTCPTAEPGPCGVLSDPLGPFVGCHEVVDPQEHVATCLEDQCGQPGGATLCRSLQGYAAACQAAGGTLREWREATNCPFECPPDSSYELCVRSCDVTCAGLTTPPRCTSRCFEGCRCHDGFLFDGAECVPPDQCGC